MDLKGVTTWVRLIAWEDGRRSTPMGVHLRFIPRRGSPPKVRNLFLSVVVEDFHPSGRLSWEHADVVDCLVQRQRWTPFQCSYGGGGRRSGCNSSSASHDPFDRPSTHFVVYFGSIGMHCSSRRSLGWGVGRWSSGCAATSLLDWISTTLSYAPFLLSLEGRGWIILFCLPSFLSGWWWISFRPPLAWDLSSPTNGSTFDGPWHPPLSFPFLSIGRWDRGEKERGWLSYP